MRAENGSVRETSAAAQTYCMLTSRAAIIFLTLVSHFFLAADTSRIGVALLNLLQAIVQGYPTPAVRRLSPSTPSPSAYYVRTACGGHEDPVHNGRRIAPSADAPIARPGATRRQGTGPRTCPTRSFHVQNEGLECEVRAVAKLRVA